MTARDQSRKLLRFTELEILLLVIAMVGGGGNRRKGATRRRSGLARALSSCESPFRRARSCIDGDSDGGDDRWQGVVRHER